MFLIAFFTLVLLIALAGLGAFFVKILESALAADLRQEPTFCELGLIGVASVTLVAAALNWLIPLNSVVATTTLALGLAAAIALRARIRASLEHQANLASAFFILALFFFVSRETYRGNFGSNDSGIYHLQTILLAQSSPLTLGVANLHSRFGYNSLWLTVGAMLVLPVWGLKTTALINGALSIFGIGAICQRLCRDFRSGQPATVSVFAVAILVLIFAPGFLSNGRELGSPSTDWPSSLLTIYVYSIAFRLAVGARQTEERQKLDLFLMFVAGAIATTFKLSQAPVALALGVTSLSLYFQDRTILRAIITGAAVASIAIVLWALHGVGLSGCFLYPIAQTCFYALPWTVSADIANSDAEWIKAWARLPGVSPALVLANWDWVPKWWSQVSHDRLIRLIGGCYIVAALCIIPRLIGIGRFRLAIESLDVSQRRTAIGLQLSALAGIAYWFFVAPDPRFGYGFLIAQPAMLIALALPVIRRDQNMKSPSPALSGALATFASAILLVASLVAVLALGRQALLAVNRPNVKIVQIASHESKSGFVYDTPVHGDQCWASPLYCIPAPADTLTFRQVALWPMFTR